MFLQNAPATVGDIARVNAYHRPYFQALQSLYEDRGAQKSGIQRQIGDQSEDSTAPQAKKGKERQRIEPNHRSASALQLTVSDL